MAGVAFQMYKNTDMEEGLGRDVAIPGLFLTRGTAENAAVGRGVYGAPAVVKEVPLFETVEEFELWEKYSDPEYTTYLRLLAKFKDR